MGPGAGDGVVPSLSELVALRALAQGRRPPLRGQHGVQGHALSTLRGRGMEYAESREYAAGDELDLHGIDAKTAEAWLREFLRHAQHEGIACLRIIHGKGRYSAEGVPVLKNLVDRMLRQRGDVLAFHSAPAAQGGTGAVVVLLKTRR